MALTSISLIITDTSLLSRDQKGQPASARAHTHTQHQTPPTHTHTHTHTPTNTHTHNLQHAHTPPAHTPTPVPCSTHQFDKRSPCYRSSQSFPVWETHRSSCTQKIERASCRERE